MKSKVCSYMEKFSFIDYLLCIYRYKTISRHIFNNCTLLDVGCGYNGYLLKYFSKKIHAGVGIDLNVQEKQTNNKIKLVKRNVDLEGFPKLQQFNVITCLAVLEHVNDPLKLLKGIQYLLEQKGVLLLTVPSWKAKPILEFLAFKLRLIEYDSIADHKRYFNKEEIIRLCKEAGFNNIEHKYFQLGLNNFIKAVK